jgi:general nucleoside transport system ATP-binding protein
MDRIQSLELAGIDKSFQDVHANRDINFTISSGEILGLLGENGAGKTTLMNILYGIYQPDAGEIRINSTAMRIRTPKDSMALGIGMVHQHFMLVQNHTVAENLALAGKSSGLLFPAKKIRGRLDEFSSKYGLTVDPDKFVWQLSAGEQQRVEIVKAMLNDADLLILDEPTSVLTPQETEELFSILRRMREEDHSVILISHKLEEIVQICDRAVVLRKGSIVGETPISSVDKKDLARMMVGRDIIFNFDKEHITPGEPVLEVRSLSVRNDRGLEAVRKMSFAVRRNEIFAIAGVSGNGQKELIEAITGLRKIENGEVHVEGNNITNQNARAANNIGITHVPEERMRFGIVPNLLVFDNAVLKHHHRPPFSNQLFLDYGKIKDHANALVKDFNIDTPSVNTAVKNLSGGNIQKLILGREISTNHALLVAAHPTYGLDVGATEFIRNHLLARRKAGGAVLLVSEDLEEIYEIADRVAVVFAGEIMGVEKPEDLPIEDIGLMMAGSLRRSGAGA